MTFALSFEFGFTTSCLKLAFKTFLMSKMKLELTFPGLALIGFGTSGPSSDTIYLRNRHKEPVLRA